MKTTILAFHAIIIGSLSISVGGCEDPAREPFEDAIADLDKDELQGGAEDGDELQSDEHTHSDNVNDIAVPPPPPVAATKFTYQQQCTTNGGGTWGSILKFCVTISSNAGTFRIYKKDGSNFTTSGLYSLKEESMYGQGHGSYSFYAGSPSYYVKDNFLAWTFPGGKLDYYAYVSSGGGWSWVGPLRIYKTSY